MFYLLQKWICRWHEYDYGKELDVDAGRRMSRKTCRGESFWHLDCPVGVLRMKNVKLGLRNQAWLEEMRRSRKTRRDREGLGRQVAVSHLGI